MTRTTDTRERSGRLRRVRRAAAALLVSTAASIVPGAGAGRPVAADGTVEIVRAGVPDANHPSLSADGRWVVFGGSVGDRQSVFRTDLTTGVTQEMSPLPDIAVPGNTIRPRLSADGCVIVSITEIPFDLFRDDDRDARWDVYRLVVPECGGQPNAWELVSMGRGGTARDSVFTDSTPSLSGSGALIAYVDQLEGAPDGVGTISIVDVTVQPNEPGRLQTVAGMPAEAPNRAYLYRGAREPALSRDGRHLAFVTDTTASAPLPGWASGRVEGEEATAQVYVWDRLAPDQRRAVQLMSGRGGVPSEYGADSPAISEDGRIVVFVSADRTLVPAELPPCGAVCPTQIYRWDRDTDRNGVFDEAPRSEPLTIVSAVDAGHVDIGVPLAGNESSWAPALDADGTQVAFVTDATNLMPSRRGGGGSPEDGDLLVAETVLGELRRVLDAPDDVGVPGAHGNPAVSTTGQTLVFDTVAAGSIVGSAHSTGERSIGVVRVTPKLSLAELDFGSVVLDFESTELYVKVQNAGPGAFEPESVVASSGFNVTGGTCAKGILVAAGSSCSVNVTFRPTAPRGYSGTLTVTGVDGVTVSSELHGEAGDPVLLADPGGADLAPGVVGSTGGSIAIDISNIWFVPTRIAEVFVSGADPDDFTVVTQSCTGRYLNPDASCAIEVQFTPTDAGYRSGLVVARTTVGEYTTALLGGYARYAPVLSAEVDTVSPGEAVSLSLDGFPVDSAVTVGFDDGSGAFANTVTDADGHALAVLQLPTRIRAGEHRIVASAGEAAIATHTVLVTSASDRRVTNPGVPGYGLG